MKTMKSFVLPLDSWCPLRTRQRERPRAWTGPRWKKSEKSLDATLLRFTPDNSHTLIGLTRGVYLEGVGAVLTAEVILVNAPVNIMHPLPTKEEMVQMRKKKLERDPAS